MKPIKITFFLFLYSMFSLALLYSFISSLPNPTNQEFIYLFGALSFLIQVCFIMYVTPFELKKVVLHYLKQKDWLIHH